MRLNRQFLMGVVIVVQSIVITLLLTTGFAMASPPAQDGVTELLVAVQQAQSAASLATILALIALVISLAAILALAAVSFNPRKDS
jgi:putative exporter of polyketide antibiotics